MQDPAAFPPIERLLRVVTAYGHESSFAMPRRSNRSIRFLLLVVEPWVLRRP